MYSMEETFEDLESAGFKVLKCNSRSELINKKEIPEFRERDYYLIYAGEKK
jgi:hypothetical protein